jgi:hypothetical protein
VFVLCISERDTYKPERWEAEKEPWCVLRCLLCHSQKGTDENHGICYESLCPALQGSLTLQGQGEGWTVVRVGTQGYNSQGRVLPRRSLALKRSTVHQCLP